MKRDMELVREILLALESSDAFDPTLDFLYETLGAKDDLPAMRNVLWHLQLMEQARLITLQWDEFDNWESGSRTLDSVRIRWEGYEFLAEAANPEIWAGAKKRAGEAFYSLSIGTLQALLSAVARQTLGLP